MPQLRSVQNLLLQALTRELLPQSPDADMLVKRSANDPSTGAIVERAKTAKGRQIKVSMNRNLLHDDGMIGATYFADNDKSSIDVDPTPSMAMFNRLGKMTQRVPRPEETLGHELGHALGSRLTKELGYGPDIDDEFMADLSMINPSLEELKAALKRGVGFSGFRNPEKAYQYLLPKYGDLLHGILGDKSRLLGAYEEPNMSRMK